jgi:hypothetical protein
LITWDSWQKDKYYSALPTGTAPQYKRKIIKSEGYELNVF